MIQVRGTDPGTDPDTDPGTYPGTNLDANPGLIQIKVQKYIQGLM